MLYYLIDSPLSLTVLKTRSLLYLPNLLPPFNRRIYSRKATKFYSVNENFIIVKILLPGLIRMVTGKPDLKLNCSSKS